MSTRPPPDKGPSTAPFKDRRAPADAQSPAGSLRWLKSLLGRPMGLVRRGGQWKLEVLERRRTAVVDALSWSQLRSELRRRLDDPAHGHAATALRHLVVTINELKRKGWPGVEALPESVLERARLQADMLNGATPSPALTQLAERRGRLQLERHRRSAASAVPQALEISEVTHEEFEAMERSWAGTLPAERPA